MNFERQITRHLAKHPQIALSIPYGSFVRRQARFRSDLDLTTPGDRLLDVDEKVAGIEGLEQLSFRPGGFVELRTAGKLVFQEILTEGMLTDDMDGHLYTELMNKNTFQ